MPSLNLHGMMAGVGEATQQVGVEAFRAALIQQRDAALNQYQTQRDQTLMAHQTGERLGHEGFQRTMETDVKQPFQREQQQAGFDNTKELQSNDIEARDRLQERSQEHQTEMQSSQQTFQHGENAAQRGLEQQRIRLEGARLGLAQQQFGLAKQQAELAIQAGTMDLGQKKRLDSLYEDVQKAKTPEEIEQATSKLYGMLGKDRFTPVHATNPMTGETTFDAVENSTGRMRSEMGGKKGSGVDWNKFVGKSPGTTQPPPGNVPPSRPATPAFPLPTLTDPYATQDTPGERALMRNKTLDALRNR